MPTSSLARVCPCRESVQIARGEIISESPVYVGVCEGGQRHDSHLLSNKRQENMPKYILPEIHNNCTRRDSQRTVPQAHTAQVFSVN